MKKLLFEIPVYQISKEKHENKWKEEKKSFFEEMEKKKALKMKFKTFLLNVTNISFYGNIIIWWDL